MDGIDLDTTATSSTMAVQIGIFLLSLLDDAALVGLSRMGLHIPGLNLLGTIVCLGVAVHWCHQIGEYLIQRSEQQFSL
jgi:hypothetical protein